jgi:hypothetical protein
MKGREFLPADVVGLLVTNGNPALAWAREAVWPVHEVGLQETITLHRHLRRMLDPAILLLIAAISLGLALARFAGLFGLPLALILISWFFKYAYALLDDVAHGVDEAPVLSMEMVNPLAQRPAAQLAICLGAWALTHWTDGGVRVAFIALLALTLPASVAILGASGKVLQAVNPLALWTVMRALGAYYAGVLALIGVGGLLAWWILALPVWLVFKLAVVQFVVLAIFNAIGAALYEHREQLDLEVLRSPGTITATFGGGAGARSCADGGRDLRARPRAQVRGGVCDAEALARCGVARRVARRRSGDPAARDELERSAGARNHRVPVHRAAARRAAHR